MDKGFKFMTAGEYIAIQESFEPIDLKVSGEESDSSINFVTGNEVLRLDENGFHYKGETIDDAGEAYRLFMDWLEMTRTQLE